MSPERKAEDLGKPDWQRVLAKYVDDRNAAIETVESFVKSVEAAKKVAKERLKRQEISQLRGWKKFEGAVPRDNEHFDPLHVAEGLEMFSVGLEEIDRYLQDTEAYNIPKSVDSHKAVTVAFAESLGHDEQTIRGDKFLCQPCWLRADNPLRPVIPWRRETPPDTKCAGCGTPLQGDSIVLPAEGFKGAAV